MPTLQSRGTPGKAQPAVLRLLSMQLGPRFRLPDFMVVLTSRSIGQPQRTHLRHTVLRLGYRSSCGTILLGEVRKRHEGWSTD